MAASLPSSTDAPPAVARIAYNGRGQRLFVALRGGAFTYFDVPREIYEAFIAAPSKGAFFNTEIRDRYDFKVRQHRPFSAMRSSRRDASTVGRASRNLRHRSPPSKRPSKVSRSHTPL